MGSINRGLVYPPVVTHEGGKGLRQTPIAELRRAVLTCLLWEDTFYEKGSDLAARIEALCAEIDPVEICALAIDARNRMYLRHVPLFLVRQVARRKGFGTLVDATLREVIQRPDEMTEYLAMYWKGQASGNKKRPEPLSAGSKRGLAAAFAKFTPYQLAKWDRDGAVTLKDVLRLTHAKPGNDAQAQVWKHVIARDLESPDTWEVELSAGKDKKATFERLLSEKKLGGLAFLRNLRNMVEAKVDPALIRARFAGPIDKVLPFRFITAARHAPAYGDELNTAMLRAIADQPRLTGSTAVVVDVSGSMDEKISAKTEVTRIDAACGVAVLVRELCDSCRVFSFSDQVVECINHRGLGLVAQISLSQPHGGTWLAKAVEAIQRAATFDRIIVITDEQAHDDVGRPQGTGYLLNVAPYKHSVGEGPWTRINGWSERVIDYIREVER